MKNLFYIFMLMVTILAVASCKQEPKSQQGEETKIARHVDCDEFEKIIANKDSVILLDVRTPDEFNEGHLKGALQIDVKTDTFRKTCERMFTTDKTIAVYCRSGFRSKTAARILSEAGFNAVNLKGGINKWVEVGKDTVR